MLSVTARDVPKAVKLAGRLSDNGSHVLFGGAFASRDPEKVLQMTNNTVGVVQGRAEGVLPHVLKAMQDGNLHGSVFHNPHFRAATDYHRLPRPGAQSSLFGRNPNGVLVEGVIGCGQGCDFCAILPTHVTARNPGEVIDEIARIHEQGVRHIMFADDNLAMMPPDHREEIFEWTNEKGIYWIGGATRNILNDSGGNYSERHAKIVGQKVLMLLTGLEDGHATQRQPNQKNRTEQQVVEDIDHMISAGIVPFGSIVLGTDTHHSPDVFVRYRDLCVKLRIPVCIHLATPMHGTGWFDGLDQEGRITDSDISHYDFGRVVFEPKNMSAEELVKGTRWLQREVASPENAARVIAHLTKNLGGQKGKIADMKTRVLAYIAGLATDALWSGLSSVTPHSLASRSTSWTNKIWPVEK